MAGLAILFAVVAIVHNASSGYQASARMAFIPLVNSATLSELGIVARPPPAPSQLLSDDVINQIVARVPAADEEHVRDRLTVSDYTAGGATLVARAGSAETAADLANGWATVVVSSRNQLIADQFNAVEARLRTQLVQLDRARDRGTRRIKGSDIRLADLLRRQVLRLTAARATVRGDAQVTTAATPQPRPNGRWNELLAAGLGGLLGAFVAVALGPADRRLRTPGAATSAFGVPLLASVEPTEADRPVLSPAPEADGMLDPAAQPDRNTLVVIASARGSSSITSAAAMAAHYASARPVILVAWRQAKAAESARAGLGATGEGSAVRVLAESGDWGALSARLQSELTGAPATTVIVAAPPLLEDRESLAAGQVADLWLVSVALGRTSAEEASDLRSTLSEASTRPAGLVAMPHGLDA